MAGTEHPMQALAAYIPDGTFEKVVAYLHQYKVRLTVTRERTSVLGDYRNAIHGKNHRISVNGNLNKYSFVITLLHELAHLLNHEKYGRNVSPHGKEWKMLYSNLLSDFVETNVFPADIQKALQASIKNPAAGTCAEEGLMRVLKKYDSRKEGIYLVEEIIIGSLFKTKDGRIFLKGEKLRKRYKCRELKTGTDYLFSAMYEVKKV